MNMNAYPSWMFSIPILFTLALSGLLLFPLPRLTRPDIYFAVTVQPHFRETPEGCEILARYRQEIVIHTLVALALVLAGLRLRIDTAFLLGILSQVLGFFSAFLRARKKVMPHAVAPSAVREADLGPVATHLPGGWLL
jgi:hypothetical protein